MPTTLLDKLLTNLLLQPLIHPDDPSTRAQQAFPRRRIVRGLSDILLRDNFNPLTVSLINLIVPPTHLAAHAFFRDRSIYLSVSLGSILTYNYTMKTQLQQKARAENE